jgi:hypothetical protein
MADDEQKDVQDEETYEEPAVEDLDADEGTTATAAGVSNGQAAPE